jgi:hypothetical protein
MKKCNIAVKEWESPLNRMKTQKVLVKIKISISDSWREITDTAFMSISFLG